MSNDLNNTPENILPDAAGLFYALRSMGYENTAAIADLIDNSIDAGASKVWVSIDGDLSKIFIADNGSGMSEDVLRTAIKLGGKKAHDSSTDLGKYGLGLITASISMGRLVRIITKQDGEYHTATLDYDAICETNRFMADFHEATESEISSFNFRTENANSGTVLIIDKCDKLQYTKVKDLVKDLEESVGEVFHLYLAKGKEIYINDVPVTLKDPLLLGSRGIERLVDQDIEIGSKPGAYGKMHVLAVLIPDQGAKINRSLQLNIKGQGFYISRNDREIAAALELPELFKKHNDFNLFRIQLSFNPDLDDLMGINLKKHDVAPSKEVIYALQGVLNGPIKKVRETMKAKQRKKAAKNPFMQPVDPVVPTPSSIPASANGADTVASTLKPEQAAEESPKNYEFNFSTYAGSDKDSLFKISMLDEQITVRYNLCNQYYAANILTQESSSNAKDVLDKAIEASLRAYLKVAGSTTSLPEFAEKLASNFDEARQ